MRKILLVILGFGIMLISKSQELIATYNGSTITIISSFTSAEKEQAFDTIMNRFFSLTGCTLDSVVIDDQSPTTIDSAAYVIFYGKCGSTSYAIGLYLTKAVNQTNDNVEYYLDDDSTSYNRAWTCTPPENCNQLACKPVRNWFLGPVVRCHCRTDEHLDCTYVSSGNGLEFSDFLAIAVFLWNIFRP